MSHPARTKHIVTGLLAVSLTLGLAACGGDDKKDDKAGETSSAAPSMPAPVAVNFASATDIKRSLGLGKAPNARDGGGYKTADGKTVKTGLLYRTDALNKLDATDTAKLASYGVKLDIDLRSEKEVGRDGADKLPPGLTPTLLPVSDGGLDAAMYGAIGSKDPVKQEEILGGDKGRELMDSVYRMFVTDEAARKQFAESLRKIADTDGPVVYHCTSGKDRTGWLSMLLLTSLGVDQATVKADYLATNDFRKQADTTLREQLKQGGMMQNPDVLIPVQGVEARYLDAGLAEVTKQYGTVQDYITKGLGVDQATIDKLKARLLS